LSFALLPVEIYNQIVSDAQQPARERYSPAPVIPDTMESPQKDLLSHIFRLTGLPGSKIQITINSAHEFFVK